MKFEQDTDVVFEPPIAHPVRFGLSVILIFFGGFLLWATLAPLESAAVAPGKITVDTYRKTIQHLEGGIIKKIMIREGSRVKAGDVLIHLDPTQAKAALQLLRGQANEFLALEARLIAQRDNEKKLTFSEKLLKQKKDPKVKKIMKSQEAIFTSHRKTFEGQIKILGERIDQLHEEIKGLRAQVTSESKQLELIKEEIVAVEYLEKRKLIELPRLLALKREAARLIGDRGEHLGQVAKTQQKIGETEQQILTLRDNEQKETLKELRETQKNLAEILEKEKAAADILKRIDIVAPRGGTIVGLKKHTIGGVIAPGGDVLEIVPEEDALVVEARINPLDIDVVHKGLVARVQLTAFKSRSTPTLDGEVDFVSADSLMDQNTGETYYTARVIIPDEELKRLGTLKLYPGMPVQVMIVTDKRTPLDYFITPIKDSFQRAFREQ